MARRSLKSIVSNGRSQMQARLAALLGAVLLSLAAIAFARAGERAQAAFLAFDRLHPGWALLLTPLTFAAVVAATRRWFFAARGSGIPQVMAALHNPAQSSAGPLVSLRTAAAKFAGTIAMLLCGGSAGREGPTVQISAAIVAAVHRRLGVQITSGVLIAGGAAGVAAAFNTPLAGVAFAIEELAAAFEQRVAVLVMGTVMISGLVSLGLDGDYIYFGMVTQSLPLRAIALCAPLAGIAGGLAGGMFSRALIGMAFSNRPAIASLRRHPVAFAFGCGLVVATAGVASAGITWGTGYETTKLLLSGQDASLVFGPAKFVATLATALSGAPGGIFAPSLSVGAGLGQLIAHWLPNEDAGAIVLLGMIGYFTGVVRAPLTAVIIMMEMTASRAMILPLFATALIADGVSAWVCPEKIYHALSKPFHDQPG